ncbi:DivIVA domain-containing protein [Erysipelothrix urinaevulpis]|uniref:DivIVA domain-containing protein n=1 Tax=Erysipelothrix urinaevulpis TaxID=2683717 RepID=UPI00135B5268|nr:DivIVA domain-containing protein [Erysipelothrix urinaevulpis]
MKQKLKIDDIFNKEFHVDFKGYSALEVDQFLDLVLHDYEYFSSIIQQQKDLLNKYEDALSQQKRLLLEYEGRERASEDSPKEVNHVDLLKRVSKLEEAVFNKE